MFETITMQSIDCPCIVLYNKKVLLGLIEVESQCLIYDYENNGKRANLEYYKDFPLHYELIKNELGDSMDSYDSGKAKVTELAFSDDDTPSHKAFTEFKDAFQGGECTWYFI